LYDVPSFTPTALTPTRRIVLGIALALSSTTTYPVALSVVQLRSAESVSTMEGIGYLSLTLLFLGLILVLSGVNRLLTTMIIIGPQSSLSSILIPLASVLRDRLSARVHLAVATAYAILFAFLSGIVVYQPELNFSTLYGIDLPSTVVVTCCGTIGQTPQLVVYLTEHLGLLVSPITITLLLTESWLVGINLAVLANASTRKPNGREGLLSGMGGILGVLTACPVCAGAFFATIIGESGVVSVAALAAYQGFFIAASIPLLVIAPILTARRASACPALPY